MAAENIDFVTPPKRKRNKDPLSDNFKEKSHKSNSSAANMYLCGSRAKMSPNSPIRRERCRTGRLGQIVSRIAAKKVIAPIVFESEKDPFFLKNRRMCIGHLFSAFGCPEKDKWKECRLVPEIMLRLGITPNSRGSVLKVLDDVIALRKEGKSYDGSTHRRPNRLINDRDTSANKLYDMLSCGVKMSQATPVINIGRTARGLPPLCYSTVERFVTKYSDVIEVTKRGKKKSGKDDPDSDWAVARHVQASQILNQFAKADALDNGRDTSAFGDAPPMRLHAIVFWDEKHCKTYLGSNSKFEYRIKDERIGLGCWGVL